MWLKFYNDSSLNVESIMSHAITSEIGMPVQHLMRLVDTDKGLLVQVRWCRQPDSENTMESVLRVHEFVPQLFRKLLYRENTPVALAYEARRAFRL